MRDHLHQTLPGQGVYAGRGKTKLFALSGDLRFAPIFKLGSKPAELREWSPTTNSNELRDEFIASFAKFVHSARLGIHIQAGEGL